MLENTQNIKPDAVSLSSGRALSHDQLPPGRLMGAPVQKTPTLSMLLQDLQEEVSFSESEDTEVDDSESEEVEDRRRQSVEEAIQRIEESRLRDDASFSEKNRTMREILREYRSSNQEDLFDALNGLTSDKGEALALLLEAAREDNDLPPETRRLAREAAHDFAARYTDAITASANSLPVARETAAKTGMAVESLQAFYQESVTRYEGILPTLITLVDTIGPDRFEEGRSFLYRAAEAELADERRTSVQPERLRRILSSLQGVKIFNGVRSQMDKLYARHSPRHDAFKDMGKDGLMKRFLHIANDPAELDNFVLEPIRDAPPRDRLLFMQDLRNAVKSLPDYLYKTPDDKSRVLSPIQDTINHLVFDEGRTAS